MASAPAGELVVVVVVVAVVVAAALLLLLLLFLVASVCYTPFRVFCFCSSRPEPASGTWLGRAAFSLCDILLWFHSHVPFPLCFFARFLLMLGLLGGARHTGVDRRGPCPGDPEAREQVGLPDGRLDSPSRRRRTGQP